jgi:hypothetical protein
MAGARRKNPVDATMRNVRAAGKRVARLEAQGVGLRLTCMVLLKRVKVLERQMARYFNSARRTR